jgi:hypothetical protein
VKPFPFMETIFSKNKQFRCWATQNFLPPQDASGMEGAAGIAGQGGGPGSHGGGGEEVSGGALRL